VSASNSDPTRDFLLRDFEHWSCSYATNEELGEKRLTIFTGLVAAVLAGLTVLATEGGSINWNRVEGVAPAALFGLMLFGLLTLFRVLRRNRVTTGYLHALATIREQFLEPELIAKLVEKIPKSAGRPLWNGGLKHIVMVINIGLASLFWMSLNGMKLTWGAGVAAIVALGVEVPLDFWLDPRSRSK